MRDAPVCLAKSSQWRVSSFAALEEQIRDLLLPMNEKPAKLTASWRKVADKIATSSKGHTKLQHFVLEG